MKKCFLLIGLLFFLLSPLAAETTDTSGENQDAMNLELTVKAGVSYIGYQFSSTLNIAFAAVFWDVIGVGAEAGLRFGYVYHDLVETTLLVVRLWWFYFGAGFRWKMAGVALPAGSEYDDIDVDSPNAIDLAFVAGINMPIIELGPGRLGLNAALDCYRFESPAHSWGWDLDLLGGYSLWLRVEFSYLISF